MREKKNTEKEGRSALLLSIFANRDDRGARIGSSFHQVQDNPNTHHKHHTHARPPGRMHARTQKQLLFDVATVRGSSILWRPKSNKNIPRRCIPLLVRGCSCSRHDVQQYSMYTSRRQKKKKHTYQTSGRGCCRRPTNTSYVLKQHTPENDTAEKTTTKTKQQNRGRVFPNAQRSKQRMKEQNATLQHRLGCKQKLGPNLHIEAQHVMASLVKDTKEKKKKCSRYHVKYKRPQKQAPHLPPPPTPLIDRSTDRPTDRLIVVSARRHKTKLRSHIRHPPQ